MRATACVSEPITQSSTPFDGADRIAVEPRPAVLFVPVVFHIGAKRMRQRPQPHPVDADSSEVETIARAYRRAHHGNDGAALLAVIANALTDLDAAERRVQSQARQISTGYARSAVAGR